MNPNKNEMKNCVKQNCRICLDSDGSELIVPCRCKGSLKYVHKDCLEQWITRSNRRICELCRRPYEIKVANDYNAKADRTLYWGFFLCGGVVLLLTYTLYTGVCLHQLYFIFSLISVITYYLTKVDESSG